MVKKTRLWRKTIPDAESTKASAEIIRAKSTSKASYTEDTQGEKQAELYPKQFAPVKYAPSTTKSEHFLLKNLPVKRPRADQSELFDLWSEETPSSHTNKPEFSHIPAVINPHPGQSYRPEAVYHEDMLEKIVEEEHNKEQDEIKHQEVVNGYRVIENDPSPAESEDDEPISFRKNPTVKVKYYTNTEKNIKKRNQLKEKLKRIVASEKKSQKKFDQIPEMLKQMDNLNRKYKHLREEEGVRKKMKIELEAQGEIVPKIRMGKFRYKKPETVGDINPADVLRKMNVKGNLVEDRFDSFVRRKMVDLAKPKDPKKVVIKECSNNEREKEFYEAKARQKSQKALGLIPLNK